jgi:N6-L-threonylcarbamoyladenine synthase
VNRTRILGIETSCDETAAAVVVDGHEVLSSVVSSQVDLHARFGGVVPEIASRAHVELLTPVIARALVEAGIDDDHVDAVAATVGPGLIGALLVGVSAAKTLALVWDVPFIAVNHLEAHLYAALLEDPELELPVIVLLVSGGHTLLVLMTGHGKYQVLGSTTDVFSPEKEKS